MVETLHPKQKNGVDPTLLMPMQMVLCSNPLVTMSFSTVQIENWCLGFDGVYQIILCSHQSGDLSKQNGARTEKWHDTDEFVGRGTSGGGARCGGKKEIIAVKTRNLPTTHYTIGNAWGHNAPHQNRRQRGEQGTPACSPAWCPRETTTPARSDPPPPAPEKPSDMTGQKNLI